MNLKDSYANRLDLNGADINGLQSSVSPLASEEEQSIATWRGERETPPSLFEAVRQLFASMPLGWRLYLVSVIVGTLASALLVRGKSMEFAFFLSMIAWYPFLDMGKNLRDNWTRQRVMDLVDSGSPYSRSAVRVKFQRDGSVFASDEGIVVVADGMLVFQGSRTHFSITSEYLGKQSMSNSIWRRPTGGGQWEVSPSLGHNLEIEYRVGQHGYAALMELLSVMFVPDYESQKAIKERDEWARSKPMPGKHCVLPPITPAPDSYKLAQELRVGALGLPFLAVIAFLKALGTFFEPGGLSGLLFWSFVGVIALMFVISAGLFRQARKLDLWLEELWAQTNTERPNA